MKITLKIDGNDKVFTNNFIPGRVLRRALEITEATDFKNIKADTLDNLVDFVVEAYNKQFSRDEFYDGVDARLLISNIVNVINQVTTSASNAMGVDTSDPNSLQRA